jgi:hypothetical protein
VGAMHLCGAGYKRKYHFNFSYYLYEACMAVLLGAANIHMDMCVFSSRTGLFHSDFIGAGLCRINCWQT